MYSPANPCAAVALDRESGHGGLLTALRRAAGGQATSASAGGAGAWRPSRSSPTRSATRDQVGRRRAPSRPQRNARPPAEWFGRQSSSPRECRPRPCAGVRGEDLGRLRTSAANQIESMLWCPVLPASLYGWRQPGRRESGGPSPCGTSYTSSRLRCWTCLPLRASPERDRHRRWTMASTARPSGLRAQER